MDTSIYAGSAGTIKFGLSGISEQFVAHLVIKRTSQVVGKFSYPAREGYQTLTKLVNDYYGYLTPEMTTLFSTEQLKIEVKPFVSDNVAPIGGAVIARIEDNTLKLINPVV